MKPHVAPGEIPASSGSLPPFARPTAHVTKGTRASSGALKDQSGLTFRQLADRTGLTPAAVHHIITGDRPSRPADRAAVRRVLHDAIRLRRSSDPGFLRQIQTVAIPFLRNHLRSSAFIGG